MGFCLHIDGVTCDSCSGRRLNPAAVGPVFPFGTIGGTFILDGETVRRRLAAERLEKSAPALLEALVAVLDAESHGYEERKAAREFAQAAIEAAR